MCDQDHFAEDLKKYSRRDVGALAAAVGVMAVLPRAAHAVDVKESDVVEMEKRMQGHDIQIDPSPDDGEERAGPIAFLADAAEGPAELLERKQVERLETTGLATALASLDARSRRIVEEGEPHALFRNPSSERLRSFLGRFTDIIGDITTR